ncbi:hypothetical protein HaLaN_02243, partial [Haematococcus lacustris]
MNLSLLALDAFGGCRWPLDGAAG